MEKTKLKKVKKVILDVITYVFLALCILAVIVTVVAKKDVDGAANIFGHQMRIVTSDSMAKCEHTDVSDFRIKSIPIRSLVFIELVPDDPAEANDWYSELKVGDVLTFRYLYATQVTITHRITSIEKNENGGYDIELAGDNKNSKDGQLTQIIDTSEEASSNYVIGKVVGQSRLTGTIISGLKHPLGIVLLIIVPCAIIILLEVLKIFKVINTEKKNKALEESKKKDDELDALRRRLAELEGEKKMGEANTEPVDENKESKEEKAE